MGKMSGEAMAFGVLISAMAFTAASCWAQEKPAVVYTRANAPAAPKLDELRLESSVSQYGMTWRFEKPARVGRFVNGDLYVVGPVTIAEITPKPRYGAEISAKELDDTDRLQPEKFRV